MHNSDLVLIDTATTAIYPLSLHDALPIFSAAGEALALKLAGLQTARIARIIAELGDDAGNARGRSEEHTSELQSRRDLVCRLLPEKKKLDKLFIVLTQLN